MSTSICQGLQSCLEPGLVEPRVLRLKLALPSPYLSKWNNSKLEQQKQEEKEKEKVEEQQPQKEEENDYSTYEFQEDKNNNDDEGDAMKNGLSFLQVLTAKNDTGIENVYVHPMVKRSASMLSAKSLEMCTESLGSETGSDSADEEMLLLSEAVAEAEAEPRKSPIAVREVRSFKRQNRNGSFPPPLTSVGGSAGLKVRPHREDGRLVLQAVTITSSTSCFHAERADGRLTLRLLKNFPLNNEKEEEEDGVGVGNESEQDQEDYEEEEEEEETTEEVNWGEDGEEEMDQAEKIQRLSRCKEDGHGNNNVLMNWDSFLVAT